MIIIKKVIKLVQIIYRNYMNVNKVFDTFSFKKNSSEPHDIKSEKVKSEYGHLFLCLAIY